MRFYNFGLKKEALSPVHMKSSKCPECGKEFFPNASWAWKIGVSNKRVNVCSYGCMRKNEKGEKNA